MWSGASLVPDIRSGIGLGNGVLEINLAWLSDAEGVDPIRQQSGSLRSPAPLLWSRTGYPRTVI